MKRTKLFIGLGAFALAIGGAFVTKANKKFAHPTNGKFVAGFANGATMASLPASFTTTIRANHTIFLVTTGGKQSTLRTSAGVKTIYSL